MDPGQVSTPGASRLFVAVSIPEHVKVTIERLQDQLRRAVPGKTVRWTRREQFHLTLKFLGNVDAEHLDGLIASLRGACLGSPVLRLRAGQIAFFPDPRRPRVVWTRVLDRNGGLTSLQRAVETASAAFTKQAPEPTFAGHVTLGRCRRITRTQADMLSALAKTMDEEIFGEWTADHVELIRSELSSTGPRHTTLASLPLHAPPA